MPTRQVQARASARDVKSAPEPRAAPSSGLAPTLASLWAAVPETQRERLQRAWAWASGPYPTLVSRLALGLVFLVSGVTKAIAPMAFAQDIRAYQMLPGAFVSIMAYGLPWLEILLGLYLLVGLYLQLAAGITGALLIIFMIAMGQAVARGLQLQCGCFGAGIGGLALREEVSVGSILRDAAWLLLAVHLVVVPSVWTLDTSLRGRSRAAAQAGARPRHPAHPAHPVRRARNGR